MQNEGSFIEKSLEEHHENVNERNDNVEGGDLLGIYLLNLAPDGDAPPRGMVSGLGCFDPTIAADDWPALDNA